MAVTIFENAVFHTMDEHAPRAEAMAVACGRILAVGNREAVALAAGPDAESVDLGGAFVTPGFTESHMHYFDYAIFRRRLMLQGVASLEGFVDGVARAASRLPDSEDAWVLGQGWVEEGWPEGRRPHRTNLDAVTGARPAIIWRADLHMAVANTKALELAGIDANFPEVPGGSVARDPDGTPSGILCDLAISPVKLLALASISEHEAAEAMTEAQAPLHALGITGVHDMRLMGGLEGRLALAAWQRVNASGRLRLRAWCCLPGEDLERAAALGLRTGMGDEWLRIGHFKFFSDGSMGARTALVTQPYTEGGYGIPLTPMAEIREAAKLARRAGLALTVHAIGDAANRALVELFAELPADPDAPAPDRIEHLQMIDSELLPVLAKAGVVASVQPMHLLDDMTMIDRELGARGALTYQFAGLERAGVVTAFGSDCPVADPDPLKALRAAVFRCPHNSQNAWHGGECISPERALWCATRGPALTCGRGHELGILAPGALADMAVLDGDPLDRAALPKAQVVMTVVGGEVVFAA